MLAQKQALQILGENALERLDQRYEGYRADAVRTLRAIIDAQAYCENEAKRQHDVQAELDALAGIVGAKRGKV